MNIIKVDNVYVHDPFEGFMLIWKYLFDAGILSWKKKDKVFSLFNAKRGMKWSYWKR